MRSITTNSCRTQCTLPKIARRNQSRPSLFIQECPPAAPYVWHQPRSSRSSDMSSFFAADQLVEHWIDSPIVMLLSVRRGGIEVRCRTNPGPWRFAKVVPAPGEVSFPHRSAQCQKRSPTNSQSGLHSSASGGCTAGITDSIRRQAKIEWLHVRDGEVAAFAAGAEAHLTGEIAVCAGSCVAR